MPGPGEATSVGAATRYVSLRWISSSLGIALPHVPALLKAINIEPLVNSRREVLVPLLLFELRLIGLHAEGYGIDCSDGRPRLTDGSLNRARPPRWGDRNEMSRYSFVLAVAQIVYSDASAAKLRSLLERMIGVMAKEMQKEAASPNVIAAGAKPGRKRGRPPKSSYEIPNQPEIVG